MRLPLALVVVAALVVTSQAKLVDVSDFEGVTAEGVTGMIRVCKPCHFFLEIFRERLCLFSCAPPVPPGGCWTAHLLVAALWAARGGELRWGDLLCRCFISGFRWRLEPCQTPSLR